MMYFKNRLVATIKHYSSWKNMKELFVIPRKRQLSRKKTESIQVSSYKTKDGGTVRVFSTSVENDKGSKKSAKQDKSPSSSDREVEETKLKTEYFAQSTEPRTVRPLNVKYSVGQVLRHKQDGYYGVIIGWDTVAKVFTRVWMVL